MQERLAYFAGYLAGGARTIVPSADIGGLQGSHIYLPARSPIDGDAEGEIFYLHRTAYAVTSQELGFSVSPTVSAADSSLAALLAVPATLAALDAELSGLASSRAALFDALLPPELPQNMGEQALALHVLYRWHLGASVDTAVLPAPVGEFIKFVQQSSFETLGDLSRGSRVFERFRTLSSKRRSPRDGLDGWMAFGRLEVTAPLAHREAAMIAEAPDRSSSGQLTEQAPSHAKPKPGESPEVVTMDDNEQADNPLVHSFEKLHTAEEYQGGRKALDDEDELALHQEALDELDLRKVIRTAAQARSVYRMDAMLTPNHTDLLEAPSDAMPQYRYDEWDCGESRYKKEFCHVYLETQAPVSEDLFVKPEFPWEHVAGVRRAMERLDLSWKSKSRQTDGPECDLDALVARYADLKSGHTPSDACYIERRRAERDLGVMILVDASLSSDAWIDNKRVLDTTKQAVAALGQAAQAIGEHFALAAFHSHSHRDCRFVMLKNFNEHWALGQRRLAAVRPSGYTRIGPAIRHAVTILNESKRRRRLLLVFTDAKPTDYDRYEGKYGIEDVRRSLEEGRESGVHTFAIAIGKRRQAHLPRMFGKEYKTLSHPLELARTIAELYVRLGK
ncbi:MAG: VWA domain-containing protein [Myxococcales bacterium]|nr:VWA domain-containing protein [Myxococcales bacterium]